MKKVAHLSTVHSYNDPRIFHKECKSLSAVGYDVYLVIPHDRTVEEDGVKIVPIDKPRSRKERILRTTLQVYQKALELGAEIYHFHDPELIPFGLMLRLRGKKVVYDIHEDYVTGIAEKHYLPRWFRVPLAKLYGMFENQLSRVFTLVLAEKYYQERLPAGHVVYNYPGFEPFAVKSCTKEGAQLLYTGNITEVRGALYHAMLPTYRDDISVSLIGKYKTELAEAMLEKAGQSAHRLHLLGDGGYVAFQDIVGQYQTGKYLAGLALFPPTEHYLRKELTKFFEYMAAGLPIICSDFPHWKNLIEGNKVGICVRPDNSKEILAAIDRLKENPEEARRMGERGQELIRSKYNWNAAFQKLIEVYQSL